MFWAEILGGFLPPEDEKSRCPVANVKVDFQRCPINSRSTCMFILNNMDPFASSCQSAAVGVREAAEGHKSPSFEKKGHDRPETMS